MHGAAHLYTEQKSDAVFAAARLSSQWPLAKKPVFGVFSPKTREGYLLIKQSVQKNQEHMKSLTFMYMYFPLLSFLLCYKA